MNPYNDSQKSIEDLEEELNFLDLPLQDDRYLAVCNEIVSRIETDLNLSNYLKLIDAFLNLSTFYGERGKFRDAYEHKLKAMSVQESQCPAENDEQRIYLAKFMCDVAQLAGKANDLDHAEYYFSESYNILSGIVGHESIELLPILSGMADVMVRKRFFDQSLRYYEHSLKILELHNQIYSPQWIEMRKLLETTLKMQADDILNHYKTICEQNQLLEEHNQGKFNVEALKGKIVNN